ncbi:hypothetical protein [Brevibacillus reuszeri]|uniref:hypothetical protein n=1 Tax=Brevibacillus reuszeri TaxID=54915 RepID=UPI000CCBDBA9|nr:hypothetical protein [Brevibacillus reuszeri]
MSEDVKSFLDNFHYHYRDHMENCNTMQLKEFLNDFGSPLIVLENIRNLQCEDTVDEILMCVGYAFAESIQNVMQQVLEIDYKMEEIGYYLDGHLRCIIDECEREELELTCVGAIKHQFMKDNGMLSFAVNITLRNLLQTNWIEEQLHRIRQYVHARMQVWTLVG